MMAIYNEQTEICNQNALVDESSQMFYLLNLFLKIMYTYNKNCKKERLI